MEVQIQSRPVKFLLDTGSLVTLVLESIYNSLTNKNQVKDASWLSLRAVNGLGLLYLGYAIVDLKVVELEMPQRRVVVVKVKQGNQRFEPILQYWG